VFRQECQYQARRLRQAREELEAIQRYAEGQERARSGFAVTPPAKSVPDPDVVTAPDSGRIIDQRCPVR
jgi:hypothetical protein